MGGRREDRRAVVGGAHPVLWISARLCRLGLARLSEARVDYDLPGGAAEGRPPRVAQVSSSGGGALEEGVSHGCVRCCANLNARPDCCREGCRVGSHPRTTRARLAQVLRFVSVMMLQRSLPELYC